MDHETRRPLSAQHCDDIIRRIEDAAPSTDVISLVDYAKGVCSEDFVQSVIAVAREHGIPVLADPGRGAAPERYRGAFLLKPNRIEAGEMTGRAISSVDQANEAAAIIMNMTDVENVVITLDCDGSVVATRDGLVLHVSPESGPVVDITGAGDTFLAVLSLVVGNQLSMVDAISAAGMAASLRVRNPGSKTISRTDFADCLAGSDLSPAVGRKLIRSSDLDATRVACRQNGQRIVFTNGCFDLLHPGHVQCLEEAAQMGDVLVVGLNSDSGIRRLKGNDRPVMKQSDRIRMLAALSCVSFIVVFDEDTPCHLLRLLRPDVLVKGGTYRPDEIVGREIVEEYGGHVHVVSQAPELSTTSLIARIRSQEISHVATNNH